MSKAPIMPFFTDAYLADCHHLSTEAHGAFLLILLHTWRLGAKPLPDDDKMLMRIVKIKTQKQWKKIKAELRPFFDVSDGHWRQGKLERTWSEVSKKIEANRESGKRGGVARSRARILENKEASTANASPSPQQSINHEPDLKPTDTIKEEENMFISTPRVSHSAIDSLKNILRESKYFMHRTEYRVSKTLAPQINAALEEIDAQLLPATMERIKQIITRLMMHFPAPAGELKQSIFSDYAAMLQGYPEDLLCAAYQHVMKHHKYNSLPKIADLLSFMEPEMNQRRATRKKLEILQQQTSNEEALA